jgi:hypothetical protein
MIFLSALSAFSASTPDPSSTDTGQTQVCAALCPPCPACPSIPPCLPEDCPSLPPCTPATQQPTAPPADEDEDDAPSIPMPFYPRDNTAVPAPPPASNTITTPVCCDCSCPTPPPCLPRLCPTPLPYNFIGTPTPAGGGGMSAHGVEGLVFGIIVVILSRSSCGPTSRADP